MNTEKFQARLGKFANALQGNNYMKSLTQGMMATLPLTMVSSVATLIGVIDIGPVKEVLTNTGILAVCSLINTMSNQIISVYIAFLIAYKFATNMKKDALQAGLMGLLAFFLLTPIAEGGAISISQLGSAGMFTAMFSSLLGARIYIWAIDHKLVIKMPDAVPPVVATSFVAIIPGILVATVFGTLSVIMAATPYGTITNMLTTFIQMPLMNLGSNIISCMIIAAFIELLWFFGMHGSMVMYPVIMVLFQTQQLANLEAYQAGVALPYLFTASFLLFNRGPRSMAVSLLCMFRCKSERLKAVGKVGFIPALFGISEPIKFGIPQVMNFRMLIPLMVTPAVSVFSAWFLMVIGFLPYSNGISVPLGFPIIISAYFTNGWQGIVAQIVQLILCALIYIPFMKWEDRVACEEEDNQRKENELKEMQTA